MGVGVGAGEHLSVGDRIGDDAAAGFGVRLLDVAAL